MIGFLRFIGLLNAAVWFGAAIFFTFAAGPAVFSQDMKNLLEAKNYPYFSGAIAEILINRYFKVQLICGIIALLHLLAERLYFGKSPDARSMGLLTVLLSITLIGGFWLQPKLRELHTIRYKTSTSPELRQSAQETFKTWHGVSQVINLLMIVGLGFHLWRVANPPDSTRFLIPGQFRG